MRDMDGCALAATPDRARANRQYVRTMLKRKEPEFAALLESLEAELGCPLCREADRVSGLPGT